ARRVWRNVARRRVAMLVPRPRTQGAPVIAITGATEDPDSGRAARPDGSDHISPNPPTRSAVDRKLLGLGAPRAPALLDVPALDPLEQVVDERCELERV